MPNFRPAWSIGNTWWIFPSRIRFRIAGVAISTSAATARLSPSAVGTSCWVTMPCSVDATWIRTWSCCSAGNASTMRSIVCAASWVCRVANTR